MGWQIEAILMLLLLGVVVIFFMMILGGILAFIETAIDYFRR